MTVMAFHKPVGGESMTKYQPLEGNMRKRIITYYMFYEAELTQVKALTLNQS